MLYEQLNIQVVSAEQQQLLAQVENVVASLKVVHCGTCEELHAAMQRAKQQLLLLVAQVEKVVASLEAIHHETREENETLINMIFLSNQ